MLPKKETSLSEEKMLVFKFISNLNNVKISWEHPNNSRKDKKIAEGKGPEIVRLTEITW